MTMSTFKRIAISNRHLCGVPLPEQLRRLRGTVDMLILREKDLSPNAYRQLALQAQTVCRETGIQLICHTFIQIAEEVGCHSIHLPFPQFWEQKNTLGSFSTVGVSVHSLEEALRAQQAGANYVIASNIFATSCKEGLPGRGLSFLREICRQTSIAVYALGGITDQNESFIRQAGAYGACRMSDYMR